MPNWCDNDLRISCDRRDSAVRQLATFVALVRVGAGSHTLNLLQTFLPMPSVYEGTVEGSNRVEAPDGLTWYDWQLTRWGVKWGDCTGEIVDIQGDYLRLWFQTPWAPPLEGLVAISREFPKLRFLDDWDEESPSKGYFVVRGGKVELDARIDTAHTRFP